jgi:hypothetical protein
MWFGDGIPPSSNPLPQAQSLSQTPPIAACDGTLLAPIDSELGASKRPARRTRVKSMRPLTKLLVVLFLTFVILVVLLLVVQHPWTVTTID